MPDSVEQYVAAIVPAQRPTFDRIQRLIVEAFPAVETTISYDMPTYVVGDRRLYVAAWKNWVSVYGWGADRAVAFVDRHPELTTGKGTVQLRPTAAAALTDDDLRDLVVGALAP